MSLIKDSKFIPQYVELQKNHHNAYIGKLAEKPVVSIISSFYNAQNYFEETFISVMKQTLQNFEWIIVDDCSTDEKAVKLFDSLPQRSNKIKTFRHQKNRGLSAGRNTAISHATGKYLFFMDLDDLIDPTYLEKCVIFLELYPEISFVNSFTVGFQEQEYLWTHGFEKSARFIEQNWVTAMLMYRKTDFDRLGGFDENLRFYEDWERWLKAISNKQKGWTIPEYLHYYRRAESGLLAVSINEESEEKKVEKEIKSRYYAPFQSIAPVESKLKKPRSYEVDNLRRRLEIENPLEWKGTGKRVLFLFPHFEVGGADKFNLDLLGLLKEKEYALTIAATIKSPNPWHEHFYNLTSDIFHLSNYSHDVYWLSIVRYLIESRKIEIVFVSNSYLGYYLVPMLRAEFPGVAFVDYLHACDPGWRIDGYPRISRQLSNFFDAQMVTSQYLADYNFGLNPHSSVKPSVCYINIDAQKWIPNESSRKKIRRQFNISSDTVVLIYPARLENQKRPEMVVKIVSALAKRNLNVKVLALGNGTLLNSFEDLINKLGLKKLFHILPPVSPEEMVEFYSAADILLLPSEYEGIALTLYEAMVMGIPAVASDVSGQSELITPETGFLVKKGDGDYSEIEDYVRVLEPLIKNVDLRRRTGNAARQRVIEKFSLELMGENVEKVLLSAIEKRKENLSEKVNIQLAEELLVLALENSVGAGGWAELKAENELLVHQKALMEASAFWKIRNQWFRLKKKFGYAKNKF